MLISSIYILSRDESEIFFPSCLLFESEIVSNSQDVSELRKIATTL